MRILNFKAENFKKIVAIDITPKGNVVIISGKNGAGKTSAIDSIWSGLQWKAGKKINKSPIRTGEKFANVRITFEDFIVNRKWFDTGKTTLTVTNREGLIKLSPQEMLDKFIGVLSFDPSVFYTMSPREQRDIFLKITGVDVDSFDNKIADIYATRKAKGQEVKLLAGEEEEITIKDLPEEAINLTDLSRKYDEAVELNNKIVQAQREYKSKDIAISNNIESIKNQQDRINGMLEENKEYRVDNVKIKEWLMENKDIDTTTIKEEMTNAYAINEQIKARGRNNQKWIKHNKAKAEYNEFTKAIETIEEDKKKALAGSKLTIKDLSIDDEGLKQKGFPISQLAESEKIKLALEIGMTLNPDFKCIFLRNYAALDKDNKKVVDDFAEKYGYLIICEQLDDSGKVGFYIENGEVKNENN